MSEPKKSNLLISISLNLLITIAEIVGGLLSNSLSLSSDALHNFSDTLAMSISYIALIISKKQSTNRNTFGFKRIEILTALFNSLVLIVISLFMFYKAYQRFIKPEAIEYNIMLIVAIIGLLANLLSVILLHHDSEHNLNIKSAYLHLLGDTLSSVAVVLGAILIHFYKIFWLDSLLTVLIGIFIIRQTFSILHDTIEILMQTSPKEIEIESIKAEIEKIGQIANIHHVHAWRLNDSVIHFECHADLLENLTLSQSDSIRKEIENLLFSKYRIEHVTIQMEYNCCSDKNLIFNKLQ